jgi:cell division protein FtsB
MSLRDTTTPSSTWKKVLGPILAFFVTFYFAYHIFQGERGVIFWFIISKKVREDEEKLKNLQTQKEYMQRRIGLLNPSSIDLDMLEELARKLLNYSKENEIIVYEQQSNIPDMDKSKGILS